MYVCMYVHLLFSSKRATEQHFQLFAPFHYFGNHPQTSGLCSSSAQWPWYLRPRKSQYEPSDKMKAFIIHTNGRLQSLRMFIRSNRESETS